MTRTVNLTWDLPTVRESGNALDPASISGVEVSLSAGATFAVAATVPPTDPQAWTFPDLVDGNYVVRLVVIDTDGRRSVDVDTPVVVDTSAPGAVTNVQVTFS